MRGVSQWLAIYKFSLVYCCAVLRGSSVTAVFWWWVTRRSFEVTALLSPLLMFIQAFWAVLDMDRGSVAEWHCWASLWQEGNGKRSHSSTFMSRWQAASHFFPIFVGMLGKRVPVFAWMLGTRCSCTLVAAWAPCLSCSLLYPSLLGGFCSRVTPGGSWPSSLLCNQFYWCGFHLLWECHCAFPMSVRPVAVFCGTAM